MFAFSHQENNVCAENHYLFFAPLSRPLHSSTFYDFHKHAFLNIFSIFLSLDSDERNLWRPQFRLGTLNQTLMSSNLERVMIFRKYSSQRKAYPKAAKSTTTRLPASPSSPRPQLGTTSVVPANSLLEIVRVPHANFILPRSFEEEICSF